jgi:hypothetical protein
MLHLTIWATGGLSVDYLDFELEVASGDEGDYVVSVLRSPAGEARTTMRFPYDELQLRNKVQALQIALLRSGGPARRSPSSEDRSVEELGRDLFAALFADEIASRLEVTRSLAHQRGQGVRLKLRIAAPELLSLPWEYLYDTDIGDYVALSVATPLVRYIPVPQQIEPFEIVPPIRILGMIAGPSDLGDLDADHERARLETALDDLRQRGIVELVWVDGERWEDLQEALWAGPWHIFHFVGHGGFNERQGKGVLYLSDEHGKSRELSATDVARLLGDHDPLRLAVLNSCETAQGTQTDIFSSTAAALVRRGTPAVVAMQFQITDAAAIQFSRVFYRAVARGLPVDAAVAEARKSIALQVTNSLEWGTPVLFMRSPDGQLFKVPSATTADASDADAGVLSDGGGVPVAAPTGPASTPPDRGREMASPASTGVAFQASPTTAEVALDAARRGRAEYTIRNLTGKRLRARMWVTPIASAVADWFTIDGPLEVLFEVGAEHSVYVDVAADPTAGAGPYSFRLDVASVSDPDDEWAHGDPAVFVLPEPPAQPAKPSRWRRILLGAGGVAAFVAGAAAAFVVIGPGEPDLTVEAMSVSPSAGAVQVTIVVRNIGGGGSGPFEVRLSAGTKTTARNLPGLRAGAAQSVTLNLQLAAGAYEAIASVDASSSVDESDEDNNDDDKSFNVPAAWLGPPDPVSLAAGP